MTSQKTAAKETNRPHASHKNGNQKRKCLKTLSKVENDYVWIWSNIYYRLQKTESGCIVTSQKNSGNRSSTLANNEIANNSSINCCKIMNKAAMPSLIITKLIVRA